jgi:adenylate cyclase class 2
MVEIEVKLRVGRTADVESRLRVLGAFLESPRELEDDVLFDFPDRRLTAAGSMLRLRRRKGCAILTFKEPIATDLGAKVRRETESEVGEHDAVAAIVAGLGMVPIWRYQKQRTTYRLGGLHALVDELPIGNFLELEGPKSEIDRWAGALGFSPQDYVLDTYRDLHEAWRRAHGEPEGPMIFPAAGA